MTGFVAENRRYEEWLRAQCSVVQRDLDLKHERMDGSSFKFLRATFFRWAGQIENSCAGLAGAPVTHCVGDLHTENYGTWRDDDGRLVWGVNDFDDAAAIPYAFDLVRLATSVFLAPDLEIGEGHAAGAILEGYRDGLDNPAPTLVYQHARWILDLVKDGSKHFYRELDDCPDAEPPPRSRGP